MTIRKHLIIGCGSAALSALEIIRRITSEDEVKLVTMDDFPPYSPASLPYLLSGGITEAELWMKDKNYFKNLETTLVMGKEVVEVIPEKQKVIYQDGSSDYYDTLLVASGSEPDNPTIEGLQDVGFHSFRTLADCRCLMRQLEGKENVVILGAGMVGIKIALALIERGCQVSVIERKDSILPEYFDEEAELYIRETLVEHKARFFTGSDVIEVRRKDNGIMVILSNGSSLNTDVLINATGVNSRVSFLNGTGVKVFNGILVDRRMGTGVDYIYAAGDAAEAQDFFSGKPKINAIIPSAVSQGRVAGANMAGGDAEYEGGIPMVALSFLGNKAFSIGLATSKDNTCRILKLKDSRRRKFKKLVFNEDQLVGGIFINEGIDPGILLHLIKRKIDMAPHKEALFEGTKPLSDPWLRSLKFLPDNE